MMGVMALAAGAANANQPAAVKAEVQTVAFDEAAFVAERVISRGLSGDFPI